MFGIILTPSLTTRHEFVHICGVRGIKLCAVAESAECDLFTIDKEDRMRSRKHCTQNSACVVLLARGKAVFLT
jgi:hypothetical protein